MSSNSPTTVTLPVSLTVESLLQVIATLSDKISRLEKAGCCAAAGAGSSDEVPPQVVAVIAAAVHATVGSRARIVKMSPVQENAAWSAEGRRAIFHSHSVR